MKRPFIRDAESRANFSSYKLGSKWRETGCRSIPEDIAAMYRITVTRTNGLARIVGNGDDNDKEEEEEEEGGLEMVEEVGRRNETVQDRGNYARRPSFIGSALTANSKLR